MPAEDCIEFLSRFFKTLKLTPCGRMCAGASGSRPGQRRLFWIATRVGRIRSRKEKAEPQGEKGRKKVSCEVQTPDPVPTGSVLSSPHLEPWHGRHLRVRDLSDTEPFPALWARPAWEKKEPFPLPRSLARPGVMGTRVAGAMSLHLSNSLVSRKEAFLLHLRSKEATRYQGH